jgi:hypothetical protein
MTRQPSKRIETNLKGIKPDGDVIPYVSFSYQYITLGQDYTYKATSMSIIVSSQLWRNLCEPPYKNRCDSHYRRLVTTNVPSFLLTSKELWFIMEIDHSIGLSWPDSFSSNALSSTYRLPKFRIDSTWTTVYTALANTFSISYCTKFFLLF